MAKCPICKKDFDDDDDKHRHIEESHNNVSQKDVELMEKTVGKEIING